MASTEAAFRKIEQAKVLIEEAQSLVEEKSNAEKQVQELKRVSKAPNVVSMR
jgi:chaperonin cofactor prefoldin